MIRVLIVDDQALLRSALVNLLAAEEGIEVVGEAADGASAVESARRHRPDVVVMDVRMPGSDGITATADIVGDPDLAQTRILILTTFEVEENIVGALRAGASGFLAKDADPGEIVRAIRVVASGDALLSPAATRSVVERLLAQPQRLDAASPGLDNLTDREREVLGYVARGLSNHEIAGMLVVSPLTIKTHVSRILAKTGSRDRAQLVALAYSSGLIRPGAAG